MSHNLCHCHQDQRILLTHHFPYLMPGFLVYSSHPLIELQVFPYLKNILLYVLTHDDVWIKPSYWFDVILQSRNL